LEYGKGIDQDFIRAAKYYHLAAELDDADAQNSFGICLERGIGFQSNLALAAHYYQQSALQGNPDGANNCGFCLEHGRGVEQDIRLAAQYYRSAADRGHPEGDLNYCRCLRLLGRWDPPDRSSQVTVQPPSNDFLTEPFLDCLKEPEALQSASAELIDSIQRLRVSLSAEAKVQNRSAEWDATSELGRGDSSVVRRVREPIGTLSAVKFPETLRGAQLIQRKAAIHKKLKHPLILDFRGSYPRMSGPTTAIVTEVAENGSLASHLPSAGNGEMCRLGGETRIARIIVGIVLAMRYIHSQRVIHCNLNPDNILLDWDWNVRIGDFGFSISPNERAIPSDGQIWPSGNYDYVAPECYDNEYSWEGDVFSFWTDSV
jgi:hypothetical protein